nr:hypothetical protein [Tanacetum cinerariifolium]
MFINQANDAINTGELCDCQESLRAQDSDKGKGKEFGGPSVNMTEEGGKNKHHKQNKVTSKGIAVVVKRTTQMLVVWEMGLRTKVEAIAWWIDSGATTHVYKDRCWFKTYEPVEDGSILYIGDDHFATVHGKGSVALEFSYGKTITLFNVLYVPKLPPYTPQQNGVAKKKNKALKEMVNSMLSYSGLSGGSGEKPYPRTYNEAMQSREAAFWKEAIDDGIAIHNLVIHQMDVKTAFLNSDLDEEVYMKQPKGFVMPGNEHKVCKLVKSLYGLKQAPKQWHQKFDEVVLSSAFYLNQSDKTDQNQVDETKKFLSSRFSMKDMGEANVILGIKIKRENKGIVITQSHYIDKILKKFNHEDCSSKAITRVFKYLRGTKDYDLSYVGYPLVLKGYSDASWINHVEDSSSTSGWVFLLRGGAISWASKKQTCITSSTMESEFVALVAAGKEAERLRNLIHEISIWPKQ